MGKHSEFPSQTPQARPKSAIYTPKRDDEHACHFYVGVPPGVYASVNSTCAQPPPWLLRGICPPCQSRGWGICRFSTARGPDIRQLPGHSRAFDTHAVSYQNITEQKVLRGKQAVWLICQGQE